jgi:hypothetical protein
MKRIKSAGWRALWLVLMLVTLVGCDSLKGMGKGVGDAFKGIKLP